MASAVPSNATLDYGSLKIGASTNFEPHGKFSMSVDEDAGILTLDFPFTVTDGLSSAIDDLEEDLREREEDLTLTWDGKARSWKKADGTGFNHRALLIKPGHPIDGRLTRHYIARFRVELPANKGVDTDGRRNAEESLSIAPGGRPTLTLTGEWTGIPGTPSAKAAYAAGVDAYFAAVIASYAPLVFEAKPQRQVRISNEEDSVLSFTLVFEGIIHEQTAEDFNSLVLIDSSLTVQRITPGTEQDTHAGGTLTPPVEVIATHDTWIDLSEEAELQDAWEDTVKPYLIGRMEDHLDSDEIALMEDAPTFGYKEATISGRMRMRGYSGIGFPAITAYRLRVAKGGKPAARIIPVASGDKRAAHVVFGPEQLVFTLVEELTVMGHALVDLFGTDVPDFTSDLDIGIHGTRPSIAELETAAGGVGDMWVPLQLFEPDMRPYKVGLPGFEVEFVDITQTGRWQRVEVVAISTV